MKKSLLCWILIVFGAIPINAQSVTIFYDDPVMRITEVPIYLFQRYCPPENCIEINDTSFIKYMLSKIQSFKDASDFSCYRDMPTAMIQIVFVETDYKYHVINMSHSLTSKTINNNSSCLIVDGQKKEFDESFQSIVDHIVNYHINHPSHDFNASTVLNQILNGARCNIVPYVPSPNQD